MIREQKPPTVKTKKGAVAVCKTRAWVPFWYGGDPEWGCEIRIGSRIGGYEHSLNKFYALIKAVNDTIKNQWPHMCEESQREITAICKE